MKKLEPDLDTILKKWPAPDRPEPAWDVQADAIASSVKTAPTKDDPDTRDALALLLASPALPAEPGESSGAIPAELRVSGDRTMSDEKDQGQGPSPSQPSVSSPPASISDAVGTPHTPGPRSEAPRSKRTSLREIAERARSSTPAPGRVSVTSTPLPGAIATPVPSAPKSAVSTPLPRSATATPLPSRPVEAGKDDSGIVNLNTIQSSATPQQVAAAEKAKPGSEGLFDEDEKPAASAKAAAPASAASAKGAKAPAAAPAKKGSGATAGIVIAILGIAAAVAIMQRGKITQMLAPQAPPPVAAEAKPADDPAATPTPAAAGEPAPAPSEDPNNAPSGPVAQNDPTRPAPQGAPWPPGGRPGVAPPVAGPDPKAAPAPSSAPGKPPEKGPDGKPGDLAGAMEKAVGPTDKPGEGATAEPASGNKGSSSVPEQPPQGSVSAAVGAVMGSAKACVAGADDVTRATITFGSSGAASSVSVTGWAASHGATGCVTSALKAAKVGPFSKASYSVGVTIRP